MNKQRLTKPTVTIIIPSYNEEKNIAKIINDCKKIRQYNIVVLVPIDKKTTDNTKAVAEKAGAMTLVKGMGGGKGNIFRKAIPYIKGEYALQIDADYQFLPADIPKLLDPLLNDGYDIALGTRYQNGAKIEKDSVTIMKRFGSHFLSGITSVFAGQRITDVMAGFKAFRTEKLKKLKIRTDHFGYEAEIVIKGAQKKYKIKNVPIRYKKRVVGTSNVKILHHGLLVLMTILKAGFTRS